MWEVKEYQFKSGYLFPGARKVEKDIRLNNKDYTVYKALYMDRIELVLNYDRDKWFIIALDAPSKLALKKFNSKIEEVENNVRYK